MTTDPFDILGMPATFDLDQTELHRRFIRLSAANHPDRFLDPLEQSDAAERAAAINEAYRTLRNPELRAAALLQRLGGPSKEQDKSLPPALLMEMMEIRERHEAAAACGDQQALAELAEWATQQRQEHLETARNLFAKTEAAAKAERQGILKQIRLELNALRYVERMIEQAGD